MDFGSRKRHRNAAVLLLILFLAAAPIVADQKSSSLELTRTARPWEFLSAVGTRAGLFGNEAGDFEAWVYALKIFRNFRLRFHVDGRVIPAEALARTVTVRPESCTIYYAGDTFSVAETLLIPINESGAYIKIDAETEQPLDIEAVFQRDFQLEWPAALGGTYLNWDKPLHAFYFGEEQKKFAAVVGSPTAGEVQQEYATNYSESHENSIDLGVISKGKDTRLIVIAASMNGRAEAESTYQRLLSSFAVKEREAADYYRSYLAHTVRLDLPDSQLQKAYDWSRISVLQGLVTNPFLGTGLIGLPHFRRKPAARICLVLWPRFTLDVFGVGCGRRFRQHAHRVGVYLQISALGWQDSARNFTGRQLCGLVQSVPISLRIGGCNAAVHHCDERVRGGKWRCRLCPAEMGELMERVSISALDL